MSLPQVHANLGSAPVGAVDSAPTRLRIVAFGLLVFALIWLVHLSSTSLVPPVDDLEQLTWVRSIEWGYYKHPPLPTWLLWLPVKAFGWSAWTVYVAGATITLAALVIMWRLVARLRGERPALVALLSSTCITYYNGRLNYYNHNVVLMLVTAACAALTWQAFASRQWRWWLALGVGLGLGALTKYQVVVTMAAIATFAVHQRFWRDPALRCGLLLALLVALVIFAPHLMWLRQHDFGPVSYALRSSLAAALPFHARVSDSLHWLADQVLNRGLPAILLLGWVAWGVRRRARVARSLDALTINPQSGARAFLLSMGLVPMVTMPLVGLLTGADLQLHWGTPFLLFVPPAIMELTPSIDWRRAASGLLLRGFAAIQTLLIAINLLSSPRGVHALNDGHWRNFDARVAAAALAGPAHESLAGAIRVVVGPAPVAAAIALALPEKPLVLIDGRLDISPWVTDSLLSTCGAVEVGESTRLVDGMSLGSALPGWSFRVRPPAVGAVLCHAGNLP